jgi:hypothetical protein
VLVAAALFALYSANISCCRLTASEILTCFLRSAIVL